MQKSTHTHTHTHGCLCKIIIPIIATFAIINPSYSDIDKNAQSATCDSSTIGTTTGPANLQADWTANTINLDFYSNDTKVGTGQCSYDGAITLPNTPDIPTGYTFGGWKVRAVASSIPTLDPSIEGIAYGFSRLNGNAGSNEEQYGLTVGSGEFATEFDYGVINGIARCSTTTGSWATAGNPSPKSGGVCWCKVKEFTSDSGVSYDINDAKWVYQNSYGNDTSCKGICAEGCAAFLRNMLDWKTVLLSDITLSEKQIENNNNNATETCPTGATSNGSTCVCQTGNYDSANWQCVVCNGTSTWNGSACTCQSGYTYNGTTCVEKKEEEEEEDDDMGFGDLFG